MTQAELLASILVELRVLRELALVAIRYPDLSEDEREKVLHRAIEIAEKGWKG